jgi:ABC-type Na+ efflux pump permease subunit
MNNKLKVILSLLLIIGVALVSIYGFEIYKKHKIVVNAKNEINIIDAEIEKMKGHIKENTDEINKINAEETNPIMKKYSNITSPYENSNKTLEQNVKQKTEEKLNLLKIIKENE